MVILAYSDRSFQVLMGGRLSTQDLKIMQMGLAMGQLKEGQITHCLLVETVQYQND